MAYTGFGYTIADMKDMLVDIVGVTLAIIIKYNLLLVLIAVLIFWLGYKVGKRRTKKWITPKKH